jgi:hypothetical protein
LAQLNREEESLLVRHAYIASSRIRDGGPPSEDRIDVLKGMLPDLVSILTKIRPEEAFEILGRYKDNPMFRKDIEIILTPNGKEWLEKWLASMREHASTKGDP